MMRSRTVKGAAATLIAPALDFFSVSVGEEPLAFPAAAEFASGLARQAIYSAVLG